MTKIFNIFLFIIISIFITSIFNYYSSSKNINAKNFNRSNINEILKEKVSNLPVLNNDTNNIIEFNNSLENQFRDNKKRSFWDLLKN